MQGALDQSILDVLHAMGWLDQCFDYLPHLCLRSLRALEECIKDTAAAGAHTTQLEQAIAAELTREQHFYGDE